MTYQIQQAIGADASATPDPWAGTRGNDGVWDFVSSFNPLAAIQNIAANVTTALTAKPASEATPADGNLAVSSSGGTSVSAGDFVPGTCKPMNWLAMNAVKNLQNQLNRIATVKGFAKITPDGQIGPASLKLFGQVQAAYPAIDMGSPSSCLSLSADADVIGDQVKSAADTLGAPASVPAPAGMPPTIQTKTGQILQPPGAKPTSWTDAFSAITPGQAISLAAVGGGILYLLHNRKKKGKGK